MDAFAVAQATASRMSAISNCMIAFSDVNRIGVATSCATGQTTAIKGQLRDCAFGTPAGGGAVPTFGDMAIGEMAAIPCVVTSPAVGVYTCTQLSTELYVPGAGCAIIKVVPWPDYLVDPAGELTAFSVVAILGDVINLSDTTTWKPL